MQGSETILGIDQTFRLFNLSRITYSSYPNYTIHSIYFSLKLSAPYIVHSQVVLKSESKEQMFYTRPCIQK